MHLRQIKPYILLSLTIFMIFGCNNADSAKTEKFQKKASQLIGTWQQTAIGEEKVSGIIVRIIFSDHTITMDAPGCMIIGDYTVDDDTITYTVTAVQGERCSKQQIIGQKDSVNYAVTDNRLTMTPLSAGEKNQAAYKRIDDK